MILALGINRNFYFINFSKLSYCKNRTKYVYLIFQYKYDAYTNYEIIKLYDVNN